MVNLAESAQATIYAGEVARIYHDHPESLTRSAERETSTVPPMDELIAQHKGSPPAREIVFGLLVAIAWVMVLASGAFVPTQAYRTELLSGTAYHFSHFAVVVSCDSLTNILFLAVLASGLGCMTCRWRVTTQVERLMPFYASMPAKRVYFAAAFRGFFLYLAIISGFLVMATEDAVLNTGFSQYIRVAGITSIFGFMVGYDPQVIDRLMGKVNDLANKPLQGTGASGHG